MKNEEWVIERTGVLYYDSGREAEDERKFIADEIFRDLGTHRRAVPIFNRTKERVYPFQANSAFRDQYRANIYEANYGQSKVDFAAKLQIALKEAAETEYWLLLLTQTNYLEEPMGKSLNEDCLELKRLLVSSVRTVRDQK